MERNREVPDDVRKKGLPGRQSWSAVSAGDNCSPKSTNCASCGHSKGDPFFFAEDKNGRTRGPVTAKPPGRREPSALKPGRHLNPKAVLSMTWAVSTRL